MSANPLEHVDTAKHHGGSVEFDYDAVSRALGENISAEDFKARLAEALYAVVRWMAEPLTNPNYRFTPRNVRMEISGRRVAVALWIVHPESFDGITLEKTAADLGVTPERLHELSADFSRQFGIKNRMQISRARSVASRKKAKKMKARKV